MEENESEPTGKIVFLFIRLIGITLLIEAINYATYIAEGFMIHNPASNYLNFIFSPHMEWVTFRTLIYVFFGMSFLLKTEKWLHLLSRGK